PSTGFNAICRMVRTKQNPPPSFFGAMMGFAGALPILHSRRQRESNMASAQQLWTSVRREAEAIAAIDPVLAPSLAASILDHPGLGPALARQIGQRLGMRA